ncbi:MAG: RNA 2',3'-cyclic phosphodiesterase [Chitinophagales bacterium]|nr:MAG: RNA 2',3'-cyclic phosphodiesterase [Chitinophagales bacterium]
MVQMSAQRLFVAIDLPDTVREQLTRISAYMEHPALRWTPPENLHITVHFIGDVAEDKVPALSEMIDRIASGTQRFPLTLEGTKLIKKRGRPVMIWASAKPSAEFHLLAVSLQQTLPGDSRRIAEPHVTLARIRNQSLPHLTSPPSLEMTCFDVRHITLYASRLTKGFPVYTALKSFPFVR